jgi:DNA mismatch repair protein MutL
MANIHLLKPSEARKIAAGESIERPAHIVKELIENAIDAGATTITLHIKQAGKEQIRIIDNGCGMDAIDAKLCFQSHATSKITSVDDLETIATYGFRGEAMASIAAVSTVSIKTKQACDQIGTAVSYTEDRLLHEQAIGCPVGTEIVIDDLFYNMPARKKFLKQDETEWHAIQQVIDAFCFSHTNIHFKLYHNEKLVFNAPPVASARDRSAQAWGTDVSQALIPINHSDDRTGISITGFISNQQFWRYGKTHQYFFVNKRWIKNSELSKALFKGYLGVLPDGRHPAGILFFTLNQAEIDVNIHPKKEEVRFSKPGLITTAITNATKAALSGQVSVRFTTPENVLMHPKYAPQSSATHNPWPAATLQKPSQQLPPMAPFVPLESFSFEPAFPPITVQQTTHTPQVVVPPVVEISKTEMPMYQILGQIMQTYIVCSHNNELIIVDQHAAHERILYEHRKHYFDEAHGIQLLFPEVITLNPTLVQHLLTAQTFFSSQGIIFDALGTHEVAVRTAPPQLRGPSLAELLTDAAHFIVEHGSLDRASFDNKFNEHMHSHMACKAAVRAGHTLALEEMKALIDNLMQVDNRFICVHGRPTLWSITKTELEKKFKRI